MYITIEILSVKVYKAMENDKKILKQDFLIEL